MPRAIGTAAAVGIPVAFAGMAGWIVAGNTVTGLPAYSLGFVYLPALVALVATSVILAPYGARLSHKLPVNLLKRIFAAFLYVLATKMLVSYV